MLLNAAVVLLIIVALGSRVFALANISRADLWNEFLGSGMASMTGVLEPTRPAGEGLSGRHRPPL